MRSQWAQALGERHPTATSLLAAALLGGLGAWLLSPGGAAHFAEEEGWGPNGTRAFGLAFLFMAGALLVNAPLTLARRSEPQITIRADAYAPATHIARDWVPCVGAILFLIAALGLGGTFVWGVTGESPVALAIIAVVLGGGLLAYAVPLALGRIVPGYVELTPADLTDRRSGTEATIAWDDVEEVGYNARSVVVFARHETAASTRRPARLWAPHRVYPGPGLSILIQGLGMEPAWLAAVVEHYAGTRTARRELGTPASIETIESLRPVPSVDDATAADDAAAPREP